MNMKVQHHTHTTPCTPWRPSPVTSLEVLQHHTAASNITLSNKLLYSHMLHRSGQVAHQEKHSRYTAVRCTAPQNTGPLSPQGAATSNQHTSAAQHVHLHAALHSFLSTTASPAVVSQHDRRAAIHSPRASQHTHVHNSATPKACQVPGKGLLSRKACPAGSEVALVLLHVLHRRWTAAVHLTTPACIVLTAPILTCPAGRCSSWGMQPAHKQPTALPLMSHVQATTK